MQKILFFCFLILPVMGYSINPADFKTVAELNAYIENNWNKNDPGERELLYSLAVEGMKKYPENAEIMGRAA